MQVPQLLWRTDGFGRLLAEANGYLLCVQLSAEGVGARFTVHGPGQEPRPMIACGTRSSCKMAMAAAEAATAGAQLPAPLAWTVAFRYEGATHAGINFGAAISLAAPPTRIKGGHTAL